jgi:hypothetical protein
MSATMFELNRKFKSGTWVPELRRLAAQLAV